MTLKLHHTDPEASDAYLQAKAAGEDFALGDSEIGPSAYFTKCGSDHPFLSTIMDGFADGMLEARETSFADIRATLQLISGEAA
jgi:hypothetical protein